MVLYHIEQKDFPASVRTMTKKTVLPVYTKHAIKESNKDRYGKIVRPVRIIFDSSNVFEVELNDNNEVIKYGVRFPYDNKNDIIYIITDDGVVKTMWLNEKTDNHKTLDLSNYSQKGAK